MILSLNLPKPNLPYLDLVIFRAGAVSMTSAVFRHTTQTPSLTRGITKHHTGHNHHTGMAPNSLRDHSKSLNLNTQP